MTLWKYLFRLKLTATLVKAALVQMCGSAGPMYKAHDPGKLPVFRHGDLEPGDILWFRNDDNAGIATLEIRDWGLGKGHHEITVLRVRNSTI